MHNQKINIHGLVYDAYKHMDHVLYRKLKSAVVDGSGYPIVDILDIQICTKIRDNLRFRHPIMLTEV